MRLIATEEHFVIPPAPGTKPAGLPPLEPGSMVGAPWHLDHAASASMEIRLRTMDEHGVSMQLLSTPFGQAFPADVACEKVREINEFAASLIAQAPDRLAGLATIPTAVPEACAPELEYCMKTLGFKGALVANRVAGTKFLSEPEYDEFLTALEDLEAPLYLHPGQPPAAITDLCYSGCGLTDAQVSVFSRFGYGWHVDVGIHALHMMATGVFDRHPKLQIILGHWGELLPFYVSRFDTAMPAACFGLEREIRDYLRENCYATSSGIQDLDCMNLCKKVMGADRLLYSADYPFANFDGQDLLLSNPDFTPEELELFAHGNAERLFKL